MSEINTKAVASYLLLPQLGPRIRRLFLSGFGIIPYLIAFLYNAVRLLPFNHPYLNPQNIGKFGLRHVIGEAANHLVIKKENWDQILVFIAILTGIVLLFAQILILLFATIIQPVLAQSMFGTPDPVGGDVTDVAFLLLDRVFGVPNFFCTVGGACTDVLSGGRWPFHVALHEMFRFYSMGLLIVAVLVFVYYIVVVVAETATTGSPFGERFQNIWVPIRLVVALFLLVPINYGLNTAQYIALFAAKTGSGFATNGWHVFTNSIAANMGARANPTGETETLLAYPVEPDITPLINAMVLIHGCAYADWRGDVLPTLGGGAVTAGQVDGLTEPTTHIIKPYLVKTPLSWMSGTATPMEEVTAGMSYTDALDFYGNNDIVIRFGQDLNAASAPNDSDPGNYSGGIEPTCGEIRLSIGDFSHRGSSSEAADINTFGGAPFVQQAYFNAILDLWFNNTLARHLGHRYVEKNYPTDDGTAIDETSFVCGIGCGEADLPSCSASDARGNLECEGVTEFEASLVATGITAGVQSQINTDIITAWQNFNANSMEVAFTDELKDRGWGGAGIWYNTISKVNGGFLNAVMGVPKMTLYPLAMEETKAEKMRIDANLTGNERYNPRTSAGRNLSEVLGDKTYGKALSLYFLYDYLMTTSTSAGTNDGIGSDPNIFITAINFIFGTHGVFAMRDENANMHPLAQLSAAGKGIVNSAVQNMALSTGLSLFGGVAGIERLTGLTSSLFSTTAFIGLTAGVVLYYILPMMPFVFFFFAVGGWVKGLFEAMVGVPLWALAHLRMDGEGLPGEAAANGYFLILEIFVRPILIVFGLIAASVIFAAQVRILHVIWDLVIDNAGGIQHSSSLVEIDTTVVNIQRDVIDKLFFTVSYVVVVYMMATASFKLIDSIPDNIMRWSGSGISSFGDQDKNPTEGLTRYAATGGMIQGQKLISATQQTATGVGSALGRAVGGGGGAS